ncbi:hypothetical protein ACFQ4X_05155 [Fictibacillus halophilus]|uniref:hypothetical protein n=1 Tax=Fictibacillus halophilus TaxID=1610490 RepID=UPI0036457EB0
MLWFLILVPLLLIIVLAVLVDRKNKRKGRQTQIKHSDIKYLCMQTPPNSRDQQGR